MKHIKQWLTRLFESNSVVDWLILAGGVGVYVTITLATITKFSIWFDEAFSVYLSHFGFADIARYTAADVHPPVYYWVLKLWEIPFGYSELAVRSLSMVFGAVAIIFGFLLVRRLLGRQAAYWSLLFMAISPMLVRYGQEARMYTMVAAIGIGATYVLAVTMTTRRRWLWVLYGVLVALGMWTHYFMIVLWLSHWVWRALVFWRAGERNERFIRSFFSRTWLLVHTLAVLLFIPWLPSIAHQLSNVQAGGFWIKPVSADTLVNYLTNVVFFQEHDAVGALTSAIFYTVVVGVTCLSIAAYRSMAPRERTNYLLIVTITIVPVILLLLLSLPPFNPSFIERYLLPSAFAFSLFVGVTIALCLRYTARKWPILLVAGIVAVAMIAGVANVYRIGNFNTVTDLAIKTRDVVQKAGHYSPDGTPIIVNSPWTFYEAVFYSTATHPVYFIDANTQYVYGSLDMLKYNDAHKIKDLDMFARNHPVVWYLGSTQDPTIPPPVASWTRLQQVSVYDPLNGDDRYKAVEYATHGSALE